MINYESIYGIGDKVYFIPTYRNGRKGKRHRKNSLSYGEIVGVHFGKSKIFYDILDFYDHLVHHRIDSDNISTRDGHHKPNVVSISGEYKKEHFPGADKPVVTISGEYRKESNESSKPRILTITGEYLRGLYPETPIAEELPKEEVKEEELETPTEVHHEPEHGYEIPENMPTEPAADYTGLSNEELIEKLTQEKSKTTLHDVIGYDKTPE
jgi:hypothetical protein